MTIPFPSSPSETSDASISGPLDALYERARGMGEPFLERHEERLRDLRTAVHDGLHEALADLRRQTVEISGDEPTCRRIVDLATAYAERWLWTFRDVPLWAVALEADDDELPRRVAACGLVLITTRAVGDLLDRHFHPRSGRSSTLVLLEQDADGVGDPVDSGQLLVAGLLLCFAGLDRLLDPATVADPGALPRRLLATARRVVLGMALENEARTASSSLDGSDDWRCLYAAVDPDHRSPLYPLLERLHAVAVAVERANPGTDPGRLAQELLSLGEAADQLPPSPRAVILLRLAEILDEARRLGLLVEKPPISEAASEPLLASFIDLPTVVERFGRQALEDVPCPVCGEVEHHRVLEKHGFPVVRCRRCRHGYVTPRLSGELREQIDDRGDETFLDAQRLYAGFVCRQLAERASGRRLLDIGFGQGHLIQAARAFGFETYGVERSADAVAELAPHLGRRLHRAGEPDEPLPWGGFDVVVLSHVLEHFADPATALVRAREACHAGGLLYVAVPDLDALQFRVFGKHWEVINPVVHYQYFTAASLTRLLERCGFSVAARLDLPPLPAELRPPRWMELFRRLGGNDSGELAMLARVAEPQAEGS